MPASSGTSPCNFVLVQRDFPQFLFRENFSAPQRICLFFLRRSLPPANPCASIRRERRAFQGIFRFSFAFARSETQGPSNTGEKEPQSVRSERRHALPPKLKICSGAGPRLKKQVADFRRDRPSIAEKVEFA